MRMIGGTISCLGASTIYLYLEPCGRGRVGGAILDIRGTAMHAAAMVRLEERCCTVDGIAAFACVARLSEKRVPWEIPELMDIVHDLGPHITTSEGLISMNNATKALSATRNGSVQAVTMPFVPAADGINVEPAPEAEQTWARLRGEQESGQ